MRYRICDVQRSRLGQPATCPHGHLMEYSMRTIFWLAGGISAGLGILTATVYGFVQPGGEVSANVSRWGFDALPNLTINTSGYAAILMIAAGAWMMIKANSTAWKQTGGY